jgi:hypothetical protein
MYSQDELYVELPIYIYIYTAPSAPIYS